MCFFTEKSCEFGLEALALGAMSQDWSVQNFEDGLSLIVFDPWLAKRNCSGCDHNRLCKGGLLEVKGKNRNFAAFSEGPIRA